MKSLRNYYNILCVSLVTVVFAVVMSSCQDEPAAPVPVPPAEVSRTVLVYMLASNNGLGDGAPKDYDMQDINEMCEAAAAGDLQGGRLLVYHSASNGNTVLKEITDHGVDTLKLYTSGDLSQSAARMNNVLDDMKELAPARDYGLILWGHGSGWLEDGIEEQSSNLQTYAYGAEDYSKYKMNITTLADVVSERGFSFLYMDCCYMASVEVLYQLRHAFKKIVAYPTEILAYGMPYDRNIKHFFSEEPDLEAAAQETFDFYDAMLNQRYRMCTVSVINTAGLERLAEATRKIYELNTTGLPTGYKPQPYMTSSTCYYFDFGSYIDALISTDELKAEFDLALAEVVEFELATERIWNILDIDRHSGLSTYIMTSDADATKLNYNRLDWYADVVSNSLIKP